jgi:hypothetical protein
MAPSSNSGYTPRSSDVTLIDESQPPRELHATSLYPVVSLQDSDHQSRLNRIISGIDESDADDRYNIKAGDNKITSLPDSSTTSMDSTRRIISWEKDDPENPYNWSSVCYEPFLQFGANF